MNARDLLSRRQIILLLLGVSLPLLMHAQNSAPTTQPIVDTDPRGPRGDVAYSGVIALSVDASDVTRGIFRVKETIPVTAGPLTLLYPKWLPGNHAGSGPITQLAGLKLLADGQPLPWRRDPVDVFAFHVEVPPKATSIEAQFDFLAPTDTAQGRTLSPRPTC